MNITQINEVYNKLISKKTKEIEYWNNLNCFSNSKARDKRLNEIKNSFIQVQIILPQLLSKLLPPNKYEVEEQYGSLFLTWGSDQNNAMVYLSDTSEFSIHYVNNGIEQDIDFLELNKFNDEIVNKINSYHYH